MSALERLRAWNEGDDPPAGYTHDALEFQQDLRWLLRHVVDLREAITAMELELERFDSAKLDLYTEADRAVAVAAEDRA